MTEGEVKICIIGMHSVAVYPLLWLVEYHLCQQKSVFGCLIISKQILPCKSNQGSAKVIKMKLIWPSQILIVL